jgi:hypothetical protein
LVAKMLRQANKDGVGLAGFPRWLYRKHGEVVVWRVLADGKPGLSLPCVLCRKTLDRYHIEWRAHLGSTWHSSRDDDTPKSKPTIKQMKTLKFVACV